MPSYKSVLDQIRLKVLNKVPGIEVKGALYCTERNFDLITPQLFDAVRKANPDRSEAYLHYLGELSVWQFYFGRNRGAFPGINPEPTKVRLPPTPATGSGIASAAKPIVQPRQTPATLFGTHSISKTISQAPPTLPGLFGKSPPIRQAPQTPVSLFGAPSTPKPIPQAPRTLAGQFGKLFVGQYISQTQQNLANNFGKLSPIAQATQTLTGLIQSLEKPPAIKPTQSAAPLPNQVMVQNVPAAANNRTRDPGMEHEVEELRKKCDKNAKALVHIYEAAGIAPNGLSRNSTVEIGEWLDENDDALPAILHQLYQSNAAQGSSKRKSDAEDGETTTKRMKIE